MVIRLLLVVVAVFPFFLAAVAGLVCLVVHSAVEVNVGVNVLLGSDIPGGGIAVAVLHWDRVELPQPGDRGRVDVGHPLAQECPSGLAELSFANEAADGPDAAFGLGK